MKETKRTDDCNTVTCDLAAGEETGVSGLADRIREQYALITPIPTRKVARKKKWLVLEVVEECYECGRTSYRLQWPWLTTYEDVPVSFYC